tara:strand:- start:17659 stop:19596 length:1938 start_codon:yes stop_codon:yes gene_type:complete
MREHAHSWLIKSVLWLVVAAFVGTIFYSWGMGRVAEQQGMVAEVLNEKISYDEYREALDNLYNLYRNAVKGRNVEDVIPQAQLKRAALNTVIQRKLLLNEAKKMGMEVSNEEVSERIKSMPAFQNDGKFDKSYYHNFLQYNRIGAKNFESNQRTVMLTEKIENLIRKSVKVSGLELREAYKWKHEKINLDYLVISPDLFVGKEEITDEKVSEYFKKEKKSFQKPNQIKVEYLFADPVSFGKEVKIGKQSIENYYTDHVDEFIVAESVRASHILTKNLPVNVDLEDSEKMKKKIEEDLEKQKKEARKKAEDILTEVKENGNFEELAKKYSEDHSNSQNGGDLGYFSRGGMIKEFEDVAFSLKVGEISDVVETKYGYHIIKITDKKEAGTKPLSDVEDEIKEKLIDKKSKKLAKRSLLQILKSPNPVNEFEKSGSQGSLKKGTTDFFGMKDQEIPTIGTSSQFKAEAFSLKDSEVSRLVETVKGYYLLRLQEKKASYIPELDEVRDEVKKSLSQFERDKIAREEAHRLKKELNEGKRIDALAGEAEIEVSHMLLFDREEAINKFGMNRSLLDAAFKLKEKESAVVPVSGKYYVILMIARPGFDEEIYKKDKDGFLKSFLEVKQNEVLSEWLVNLRKNANVTINEQFL